MPPSVNPPQCPDKHGAMERTPGYWALSGVDRSPPRGLLHTGMEFTLNGKGCILKLWSCPVCKLARIYTDDAED